MVTLKNYGLCLGHYLSALFIISYYLSWDAMLSMIKVELELISDRDTHLSFEKGMRGGVSYTSKRYSKANNKYLKSYDPKLESKHIHFDPKNLYGHAMSTFLLSSRFKWINTKKFA